MTSWVPKATVWLVDSFKKTNWKLMTPGDTGGSSAYQAPSFVRLPLTMMKFSIFIGNEMSICLLRGRM